MKTPLKTSKTACHQVASKRGILPRVAHVVSLLKSILAWVVATPYIVIAILALGCFALVWLCLAAIGAAAALMLLPLVWAIATLLPDSVSADEE